MSSTQKFLGLYLISILWRDNTRGEVLEQFNLFKKEPMEVTLFSNECFLTLIEILKSQQKLKNSQQSLGNQSPFNNYVISSNYFNFLGSTKKSGIRENRKF